MAYCDFNASTWKVSFPNKSKHFSGKEDNNHVVHLKPALRLNFLYEQVSKALVYQQDSDPRIVYCRSKVIENVVDFIVIEASIVDAKAINLMSVKRH